ncbi:MAG: M28 family peptidase, partial [Planctomycetota bacterium]
NMDMISRNNPAVVKIGRRTSDEYLGSVIEQMAKILKLTIDETEMDEFLDRSDHAPFLSAGIPAVFFFGGMHADYHSPTDDVEYLIPVKMENIGRLAFLTSWGLLQQVIEPGLDEPGESD